MDLLIDCGNTRIKWVLAAPGERLPAPVAGDEQALMRATAASPPTRIAIASVRAGPQVSALCDWAERQCPGQVWWMRTAAEAQGLVNAYAEPERLGVDRWLAMLGAWRRYHEGFLLVDCGTAVTLDLVTADGQHQGGAILPGPSLMVESLIGRAEGIRPRPDDAHGRFPGRDTGAALSAGALMAVRGGIREAWDHARARGLGRLLMTGGAAPVVMEGLGLEAAVYIETLVFEGMVGVLACSD